MNSHPQAARASSPKLNVQASSGTGTALVLIGVLLIFLSVGESIARVEDGGGGDVLRGSGEGEMISGNSGNDRMYGLSGDDELYGGPGRDVLLGGGGNDFVEARDGRGDYVDCGGGHGDVASVDDEDYVSADCETVYRG